MRTNRVIIPADLKLDLIYLLRDANDALRFGDYDAYSDRVYRIFDAVSKAQNTNGSDIHEERRNCIAAAVYEALETTGCNDYDAVKTLAYSCENAKYYNELHDNANVWELYDQAVENFVSECGAVSTYFIETLEEEFEDDREQFLAEVVEYLRGCDDSHKKNAWCEELGLDNDFCSRDYVAPKEETQVEPETTDDADDEEEENAEEVADAIGYDEDDDRNYHAVGEAAVDFAILNDGRALATVTSLITGVGLARIVDGDADREQVFEKLLEGVMRRNALKRLDEVRAARQNE